MRIYTKRYGSFALAMLIWLNAISATLVFLDYELRKDFIAEVLCINKNEPEFRCAGSCHLKKNLQKTQDSNSENPDKIQNFQFEFIAHSLFKIVPEITKIFNPKTSPNFGFLLTFYPSILFDFFHPPQA